MCRCSEHLFYILIHLAVSVCTNVYSSLYQYVKFLVCRLMAKTCTFHIAVCEVVNNADVI